MDTTFKFRAFISYSHRDKQWGDWLHRALESYGVPKNLVGTESRDGAVPAKLFPIFRDREELPSSADLNEQIRVALESSAYLIVICSPNAAASHWVNEEILSFKRMGRENRILALIVDGEPNAGSKSGSDIARECFPNALKFRMDAEGALSAERAEPIAADARPQGDGRNNAKLKLLAGLLGVGYDALRRREEQAARQRARIYQAIAASMAFLAVCAVVAAFFAFQQRREARFQRDEAVQAQMRLLTQASSASLKNSNVPEAEAIILEVLANPEVRKVDRAAAISVFQEARAADAQIAVLTGHGDSVETVAYSPDGRRIVTASDDKTARIWDVATGDPLMVLSGHDDVVASAAYSPDGKRILTASVDKTIRIWDASTGAQLKLIAGTGPLYAAAWSPDGRRFVTASVDRTARVFDAATGKQLAVLSGHSDIVAGAAWSPDGKRIVTASNDKTARVWDAATGRQLAVLSGHTNIVNSAAFSPDGKHIATASYDKTARIWDASTYKQTRVLSGNAYYVNSVAYSRDGGRIVTASYDKTVRIWDAATGALLATFSGHDNFINDAVFSPDGTRIASSSLDKTVRFWDAKAGAQIGMLRGHSNAVSSAAYSPDGRRIATSSYDNTARVWDATTGTVLATIRGQDNHVDPAFLNSAIFSPDGKRIVTTSYDKTARIWDAATGAQLKVLAGHTDIVSWATYSKDGKRIVSAANDKTARIWDAATGAQLFELSGHGDGLRSAVYSPDGSRILTAGDDKTARIWNAKTGAQLTVLSGHGDGINSAAYSPDGKFVVTASKDFTARIWDAALGSPIAVLTGHTNNVTTAAYSPDGRHIVTSGADGTVRLWDANSGTQLAVLQGHGDIVNTAAYSPDGRHIVSAGNDNTARIWSAQTTGFDAQLLWAHAAQIGTLSAVEREKYGLPLILPHRSWPEDAAACDRDAAASYDPDRHAPGESQIAVELAVSACSPAPPRLRDRARFDYQLGRALAAKGDLVGARRALEKAVSAHYRAAAIDLADLLLAGKVDAARAVTLYEQAAKDGVAIADFKLGALFEQGARKIGPNTARAWDWYAKGAALGEPNALARFGRKEDFAAMLAQSHAASDAQLLAAFQYYTAAVERADQEDWPDASWQDWNYRRATLARLLARDGMMQQVADAYAAVRERWGTPPPGFWTRTATSLGL